MDNEEEVEEFLAHYGVLGMKWGVRKANRGRSPDYSDQQVKRDRQVYGRRGSNRINRNMKRGDKISVARGAEKGRRDRVIGRNKYVRQGGKVAGAIGGVVLGNVALSGLSRLASSKAGLRFIAKITGSVGNEKALRTIFDIAQSVKLLTSSPTVRIITSAGAAKVGEMLSGDIAVSANMRLHGYDPKRKY